MIIFIIIYYVIPVCNNYVLYCCLNVPCTSFLEWVLTCIHVWWGLALICVYACVCACVCACVHACVCACVRVFRYLYGACRYMQVHACLIICICARVSHVCMHACACMHALMCTCVSVRGAGLHVCSCVCVWDNGCYSPKRSLLPLPPCTPPQ